LALKPYLTVQRVLLSGITPEQTNLYKKYKQKYDEINIGGAKEPLEKILGHAKTWDTFVECINKIINSPDIAFPPLGKESSYYYKLIISEFYSKNQQRQSQGGGGINSSTSINNSIL
jgi:hypothetical protein